MERAVSIAATEYAALVNALNSLGDALSYFDSLREDDGYTVPEWLTVAIEAHVRALAQMAQSKGEHHAEE